MAVLTIKAVDEALHADLKRFAATGGLSLNSYVISVLEQEIGERLRLESAQASLDELDSFVASLPPSSDSTAIIREQRDSR